MTPATGTRLRADAQRNRERIIDAAREALVQDGPDAALDDIARSACVGNATLYRHFPDRDALIRQVVLAVMDRVAAHGEALLTDEPDAFEALRHFVFAAADERVGALCPMLTDHIDPGDPDVHAAQERLHEVTGTTLERARRSGQLRDDVEQGDLLVALSQLTRPLPGTGCAEMRRYSHRHLLIFLDGLRAPAGSPLTGRAPTFDDLRGLVDRERG